MEVDGKRMEITLEEIQEWAEQVEGFLASRFSPSHLAPDPTPEGAALKKALSRMKTPDLLKEREEVERSEK